MVAFLATGWTAKPAGKADHAHDANWNVSSIMSTSGTTQERYVMDPFGSPMFLNASWSTIGSSAYAWSHLHQGGRFSGTASLYHFRHRELSPNLGRWEKNDPIQYHAGTANLFKHVANRPLSSLDPLGLWELRCRPTKIAPILGGVPGAVTGAAVGCAAWAGLALIAGVPIVAAGGAILCITWGIVGGVGGGAAGAAIGNASFKHCWVVCEGSSYSLMMREGLIKIVRNDPSDSLQGEVVASGPGSCDCIHKAFMRSQSIIMNMQYDHNNCNSNWFANQLLSSCGICLHRPPGAWGWGDCSRWQDPSWIFNWRRPQPLGGTGAVDSCSMRGMSRSC